MTKKDRKPKHLDQKEPHRSRLTEDEVIQIAETRGNEPYLTAGDLAFAWGVSTATIYKYSPCVKAHMTPWEKHEILEAAKGCGVSPSTYLVLLHQEFSKKLQDKIKKGGLKAVS